MRNFARCAIFVTVMAVMPLFAQSSLPRYFLDINNKPEVSYQRGLFGGIQQESTDHLGSADAIRTVMIKRHHVLPEQFTEKREKADYILRINSEGANCRWTVLRNDPVKEDEVLVASKKVIYCWNAPKDVLAVATQDWIRPRTR